MFETFAQYPLIEPATRLLIAAGLGMVIGIDREFRDHEAGLRTHMLVSLAAAAFAVITLQLAADSNALGEASRADTLRIIEAVTAGVAFLGAGAIIHSSGDVRGLTTGASMWLCGGIGVAAGAGYFGIAAVTTAIGFVILSVVRIVEKRARKTLKKEPKID
ncbi:MAG: MgtC/SapB family protein [Euryhalocaulis sp.]|uniref:MgtC/SapB family protein n=1 Tax=Euryhalocaulis sp. TaxID=2744307 RepID=UPI0017FBB20E|nr:MgtC/SapB family protein [Euryhalocaulis sp.]MBA4801026.1 MgtC/SapB family protein [Euryhalocaulis sp.]